MSRNRMQWDRFGNGGSQTKADRESIEFRYRRDGDIGKDVYKMYGEYLENLRQPYPEHLLAEYRKEKQGGKE